MCVGLLVASWLMLTILFWLLVTMAWLVARPIVLTIHVLVLIFPLVLDSRNVKPSMLSKMLSYNATTYAKLKRRTLQSVRALLAQNY